MTHAIATTSSKYPKAANGLTLPLSKSLGSRDLQMHRASIAVELEVMSKKIDRFGWERDRGSMAHDRLLMDWMDALQDYPLAEIQAACREAIIANPNRAPNEGHIVGLMKAARAQHVAALPKPIEPQTERRKPSPEEANAILRAAGFTAKRMPE